MGDSIDGAFQSKGNMCLSTPSTSASKGVDEVRAHNGNDRSDRNIPDSLLSDTSESSQCSTSSWSGGDLDLEDDSSSSNSFRIFRLSYILVNLVIMLADGLQGKCEKRAVPDTGQPTRYNRSCKAVSYVIRSLCPIHFLTWRSFHFRTVSNEFDLR